MAFWRIYYHLIWSTKQRHPMILPQYETNLYNYMIGKADSMQCIVHAIGGVADHIHVIISIPPRLSVAEVVKKIKGSSSHYMNEELLGDLDSFMWQNGYGALSLGEKQLEKAIAYVRNQKEHHAQGSLFQSLESVDRFDDGPQRFDFRNH